MPTTAKAPRGRILYVDACGGGEPAAAPGPDEEEIIRILLGAGADPTIADGEGVSPLQHAEHRGYDEIAALLRR